MKRQTFWFRRPQGGVVLCGRGRRHRKILLDAQRRRPFVLHHR